MFIKDISMDDPFNNPWLRSIPKSGQALNFLFGILIY